MGQRMMYLLCHLSYYPRCSDSVSLEVEYVWQQQQKIKYVDKLDSRHTQTSARACGENTNIILVSQCQYWHGANNVTYITIL